MYEPKVKDFITTNGRHILVYDYFDYPFTIMLASDIVIGIHPDRDEMSILVPNEDDVYQDITIAQCLKPTRNTVYLNLQADNLLKYVIKGKETQQYLGRPGDLHTLLTHFVRHS